MVVGVGGVAQSAQRVVDTEADDRDRLRPLTGPIRVPVICAAGRRHGVPPWKAEAGPTP